MYDKDPLQHFSYNVLGKYLALVCYVPESSEQDSHSTSPQKAYGPGEAGKEQEDR